MEYQPTSSFCYHFARYTAIPEILRLPEVLRGEPFRLIDLVRELLDRHFSVEQQIATFMRPMAGKPQSVAAAIKFYVPFVAENTDALVRVGSGMFRLPSADDISEDEQEAAAADAENDSDPGDPTVDLPGWVYAFTFPLLIIDSGIYPIKIGRTIGDVEDRIAFQGKSSALFESPKILGRWQTDRVQALEYAIHNVLRSRGKWREHAPGKEWFNTSIQEIESIVRFVETG